MNGDSESVKQNPQRIYLQAEGGDEKQNYFHSPLLEIFQNIREISGWFAYIKPEQGNAFKLHRNFSFTKFQSSLSILESHSHFNSLSAVLASLEAEHFQGREISREFERAEDENFYQGFAVSPSHGQNGNTKFPIPATFPEKGKSSPRSKGSPEPDPLNLLGKKAAKIPQPRRFYPGNCAVMETPQDCNPSLRGAPWRAEIQTRECLGGRTEGGGQK